MSEPELPSITCPVCAMTSYSLPDIREGYCGNCHDWTRGVKALAEHIAWLESIGQEPGCTCRWAWKSLGRMYGTSAGKGWVRMNTASDCPAHKRNRR